MRGYKNFEHESGNVSDTDVLSVKENQIKWKDIRFYLEEKRLKRQMLWHRLLVIIPIVCAGVYVEGGIIIEIFSLALGIEKTLALSAALILVMIICAKQFLSSSAMGQVRNIKAGAAVESKYMLVQHETGKIGLLKKTWVNFVKVRDFKYDSITRCTEDAYICKLGNKYGMYNTLLHKMVLPEEYDSILYVGKDIVDTVSTVEDDIVVAAKDGIFQRFTTKGYRVME